MVNLDLNGTTSTRTRSDSPPCKCRALFSSSRSPSSAPYDMPLSHHLQCPQCDVSLSTVHRQAYYTTLLYTAPIYLSLSQPHTHTRQLLTPHLPCALSLRLGSGSGSFGSHTFIPFSSLFTQILLIPFPSIPQLTARPSPATKQTNNTSTRQSVQLHMICCTHSCSLLPFFLLCYAHRNTLPHIAAPHILLCSYYYFCANYTPRPRPSCNSQTASSTAAAA